MYRNTSRRAEILEYVRNSTSHPTADYIHVAVRRKIPGNSKDTVYRNLRGLHEQGTVKELNLNGEIGRFEAACGNHHHFRCESFRRVLHINEPVNNELEHNIAGLTGLKITSHQLEFHGLCIACR